MFLSHYPLRVLRLGRGTIKSGKEVIKNIISWLQVSPEPYKCLDLLSQLWPLLKPPFGNQHLIRLLNSSLQFFFPIQYTQHTSQCWICISVSLTTHGNSLTLNLAVPGQLYLPFPTKNYTTHWDSLRQCPTLSLFKPNQIGRAHV